MRSNCCQTFVFEELSLLSLSCWVPLGEGLPYEKHRGYTSKILKRTPKSTLLAEVSHDKTNVKREERDLCRLPTCSLSRMPSRFLNQWRFCHVRHKPENRFEFERERERLNLSTRSNFKWSWRWNGLASGRCRGPHYKSLRNAEEANLKANFSFFTSLSTGEARVFRVKFIRLYGTVDSGLFFLRIKRFVERRLASDGWIGFPANRGLSRRSKTERFVLPAGRHANVSRLFRKPSMTFLCRDVISLYVYRQA